LAFDLPHFFFFFNEKLSHHSFNIPCRSEPSESFKDQAGKIWRKKWLDAQISDLNREIDSQTRAVQNMRKEKMEALKTRDHELLDQSARTLPTHPHFLSTKPLTGTKKPKPFSVPYFAPNPFYHPLLSFPKGDLPPFYMVSFDSNLTLQVKNHSSKNGNNQRFIMNFKALREASSQLKFVPPN